MNNGEAGSDFLGIHLSGSHESVAFWQTVLLVLLIGNAIWIFRDARKLGQNPWIAVILLLIGWPLSNFWWLWLRPKSEAVPKDEALGGGLPLSSH